MRKTVSLLFVVDQHNSMTDALLKNYATQQDELNARLETLCVVTETLLMSANAYNGFRYAQAADLVTGKIPNPYAHHYYRPKGF